MQGYCVRCKAKQEMRSPTRTLMKNGRRAMIGLCACCGTKMSVIGGWDADAVGTHLAEPATEDRADLTPAHLTPSPGTG